MINTILNTDGYKPTHWLQYPPGTTGIFAYIESRGSELDDVDRLLFFGLQAFIKRYLQPHISEWMLDEAEEFLADYGVPFHRKGWKHILQAHGGRLPVHIRAIPEGNLVPLHNAMLTIENTDPACYWLPTYLETALLRGIWYPTSVATLSFYIKKRFHTFWEESSTEPIESLDYKLHDFGARGVSSHESAELGGMANLVNFRGTDTISGALAASRYYGARCPARSIPAAEHSTITAWGRDGETEAYANMLDRFAQPGSVLAVVSDSYDLDNAVRHIWGERLRQRVKDSGAVVVIRPDSGDPVDTVRRTLKTLAERFGYAINRKGYQVLPNCIRIIQGDSVNRQNIDKILTMMRQERFSIDNIAFGMGGALLQKVHRDTFKFAMKCSAACVGGKWRDVYKEPKGQPDKLSKRGRLILAEDAATGEVFTTTEGCDRTNLLRSVFRDGKSLYEMSFDEVRRNAAAPLGRSPAIERPDGNRSVAAVADD